MTAGACVHMNMEATGESWVMFLNGLYLVFYSYLCVLCVCARMKGMCHFVCFPISCSDYPFVCNGEHGAGAWRQACLASVRSWIPFPAPALKQKSICNGETHCRVLRLSMRQKLTSGEQPKIRKEAGLQMAVGIPSMLRASSDRKDKCPTTHRHRIFLLTGSAAALPLHSTVPSSG